MSENTFFKTYDISNVEVKESHIRSKRYGVNKKSNNISTIISEKKLERILESNKELLKICKPFIEDLYNYVKGTGFFIELFDKNGIILSIIGDQDIIDKSTEMNMIIGTDMSEKKVGTNAISLALEIDKPVQLLGTAHYLEIFHQFTCSCGVIHNEKDEIIACINLTGWSYRVHKHTLALVVAAVRSIENDIKVNKQQKEIIEAYKYTNTIINSLDMGVITVDFNGGIKHINYEACKMIEIYIEDAIGRDIFQLFEQGDILKDSLFKQKTISDTEICTNSKGKIKKFLATTYQIYDDENNISGNVILLKDIKKVLKFVKQYVGMDAKYNFNMIIGNSTQMIKVKEYAKKVSSSPSTILIQGESGTGKELLAQAIHNESNRKHRSFVALNCGAIPNSLIESELFGFVEGAFTGAQKGGYSGKLALADKGTLFLDEIGEMPIHMQVHLLRFLQEGKITRIGDKKNIDLDVKIIAATNKNLKEEVEKGRFREDLYYRLNVIPIYIAPLRERNGDIELLIEYFLKSKAIKLGKDMPELSNEMYSKLISYTWPGNIRELENCIENIVNFDGQMSFDLELNNNRENIKKINNQTGDFQFDKNMTLGEWEEKAIINTLINCHYNYTKAAKILGITRATLYSKVKKYNINIV
ncbi:sigma-54 interaction domain-containing protein [Clostridium grantii]|uniref:Transcriptional regulator containing PAS, AAA-type ATPase, and DNA-binding Fis domains n=1 Tax=Clostridium grantii DSM 8605 TaxID=1121316 RepID=A0A1M5XCI2_9CLOT|nr:sigma 54-interacting transcriptional regulator [Clostridium grantii]SHH97486.1 Transcriptional regulator containing PAS, AAA-type ATPase, and DNA-binding Fis domains [Clostridium grantii DSM 8605]